MSPAPFLLLAFILVDLAEVIHSYQQRHMLMLSFLFWVLVWMGTAAIIILPDATSFLAHLLGIGRGPTCCATPLGCRSRINTSTRCSCSPA